MHACALRCTVGPGQDAAGPHPAVDIVMQRGCRAWRHASGPPLPHCMPHFSCGQLVGGGGKGEQGRVSCSCLAAPYTCMASRVHVVFPSLHGFQYLFELLRPRLGVLTSFPGLSLSSNMCFQLLLCRASEATKWLNGRLTTLALCEASKDDVVDGIQHFLHPSNPFKVRGIFFRVLGFLRFLVPVWNGHAFCGRES